MHFQYEEEIISKIDINLIFLKYLSKTLIILLY